MTQTYNVYCDESCHLEHDRQQVMVLGATWCPLDKSPEIQVRLREIKARHGLSSTFELKWTKVSPAKLRYYLDVLDYFFDDDDLCFRALIIPNKSSLNHRVFQQDHDTWYYKMFFDMLKVILRPDAHYRVYLDIKDTRSSDKVAKLHDVLCNNLYDFDRHIIQRVQTVRSHEVEVMQLADLLIGVVQYANKGRFQSKAKSMLVERMKRRSGYSLSQTTLLRENKVNLFRWHARQVNS